MKRTKIEYADFSWNPGLRGCLRGCWYCYGRRIYSRLGLEFDVPGDGETLEEPFNLRSRRPPAVVFVGNMSDLFFPLNWGGVDAMTAGVDGIIDVVSSAPWHEFLFLTKSPRSYALFDFPPSNAWLGVTTEGEDGRLDEFRSVSGSKRRLWVSWEPVLGPLRGEIPVGAEVLVAGALTGPGSGKHRPNRNLVLDEVYRWKNAGRKVFLKDNLVRCYPELGRPEYRELPWRSGTR